MQSDDEERPTSDREPFLAALRRVLDAWAVPAKPQRITVALSGGLDSSVLLAALKRLDFGPALRALHVDHGLHADSSVWSAHCAAFAADLSVEFVAKRVVVDRNGGLGLEGAAREARYRALRESLGAGEWLLTAHHADDQLETLLLRLLRGTGVRGLRGILGLEPFGAGSLGRPLLAFTRDELAGEARAFGLTWLKDPSNDETRHDRNYLRLRVLPALRERWPAAAHQAQRLAAQMADAERLLEAIAASDAEPLAAPWCVPRATLAALDGPRQCNLIRYLVRRAGLGIVSARKIDELRDALLGARPGAQPLVRWPTGEGRVFREALYLLAPLPPPSPPGYEAPVAIGAPWSGSEGQVAFVRARGADGLPESWLARGLTLRFRGGGERFKPHGRGHHHTLKHLFQEAGVVPWMRARVPLLYRDAELVAVGDLWVSSAADAVPENEPRWRVEWTPASPVLAPEPR
ncbi:MAG TPA: tRNA lysidine(34) synthetase TilS [Gammaproteobacteria bacterium]|nr:tRNA lysidine(34) synthetase TilS [Gammaproteobacteria bacterium]